MDARKQNQDRQRELVAEFNREYASLLNSPEFQAAVQRESDGRDYDMLDLPRIVCGIELRPLSLRDLVSLYHLGTPFLSQAFLDGEKEPVASVPSIVTNDFASRHVIVTQGDIARFLWIQSEQFRISRSWLDRWRCRRFTRRCRVLKYGKSCDEIRSYINDAMMDSPAKSGASGSQFVSWSARMVHMIAVNYGWTDDHIMRLPIGRVFQYYRAIISGSRGGAMLFNKSDQMKGDLLCKFNRQLAENN